MKRLKLWLARQYAKGKTWLVAMLVALGLVAGGVALAQTKTFNWTNPTENVDGSPFDAATEQAETRIYCDVDPATFGPESPGVSATATPTLVTPGAAQTASRDFLPGNYSCFGTVISIYGYESMPSNVTTFTITPTVAPSAITDFAVD